VAGFSPLDHVEDPEESVQEMLMRVLEEAMILPLVEAINRSLANEVDKAEERELVLKMHYLRMRKDQVFFGAKPELTCPSGWADAVAKLTKIDEAPLPQVRSQGVMGVGFRHTFWLTSLIGYIIWG
jgi:hypothetical protein